MREALSRAARPALLLAVILSAFLSSPLGRPMLIGSYQPNNPGSTGQLTEFAREAGFTPRIASYYTSDFAQPFAAQFAREMAAQGTQVLLQWQPRGTTNAAIASGQEDAVIRAAAQAVATVNATVIISYGQEMNGSWYPWGNAAPNTPADYIAAYRRVWAVFQEMKTYNVTWLWDPNVSYTGSSPLKSWYPGDQYVDWAGLDGYFSSPSVTFDGLFGPSIAELRSFTAKPLVIGESGVTGEAGRQQIQELFAGAALAGAVAIVYFDEAQSGDPMHQDWRLENNPGAMQKFREMIQVYGQRPLVYPG